MRYVLKCEIASKQRNKPVYYKQWTGIGPMYTECLNEAERFNSEQEAMQSPAYYHSLTCFEPHKISS